MRIQAQHLHYGKSNKQQGAALVVALLILSLVTVLAASMTIEHNFTLRRVSNQLTMQQAYSYLRGVEAYALKGLRYDSDDDKSNSTTIDHFGEIWYSYEGIYFPIDPEGDVSEMAGGKLRDLQGRFNVNNLQTAAKVGSSGQPQVPFTAAQGIFIRLLQTYNDDDFQISADLATQITEAVVDFIDEDSDPLGFNCGEDSAYTDIEGRQPHRTPNTPIVSVSELRLVCNMPVELYERLKNDVTVWPLTGDSTINVNTASEHVLRSIFIKKSDEKNMKAVDGSKNFNPPPPLDASDLETVIARLAPEAAQDGYAEFSEILLDVNDEVPWPNGVVSLSSDYFIFYADIRLQDLSQSMTSVISRKDGIIKVLARSTGGL